MEFNGKCDADRYLFIAFERNSDVEIALSDLMLPGIMTVFNSQNARVAKHPRQVVDGDFGVEAFDFWGAAPPPSSGDARPAFRHTAALRYNVQNLLNGRLRPELQTNGWVPAPDDATPRLTWNTPLTIRSLTLMLDNDFDNAMETVQMGHAEAVTPHCVTHYRLWVDNLLITEVKENHHSLCHHTLKTPMTASKSP